jgi:hypothetical protein
LHLKDVNSTNIHAEGAADAIGEWMKRAASSSPHGLSKISVVINAEGKDLPSLTLIDLPGIVRTMKEDKEIEENVIRDRHDMLTDFVKQKRTVILAVVAANVAVENQEVLKMAKDADPAGDHSDKARHD